MKYWLMKTEPETFSFERLAKEKTTIWDGVRNFQARNFMSQMKKDDLVLIYHSGKNPQVLGVGRVAKEHYLDPTDNTGKFLSVDIAYEHPLKKPVTLAEIKMNSKLKNLLLVRQSRLSVMPIEKLEWDEIIKMSRHL